MTRERLKRVAKLLTTIVEIKSELDTISREERDKYETLTEAQKQSDRGEQILYQNSETLTHVTRLCVRMVAS
jgi:hypothetical protein